MVAGRNPCHHIFVMQMPDRTRFFLSLLMMASTTSLLVADPVISEFMASNSNGLQDEDGDNEDWIEVFNPDATSVNLSGWALTDDSVQPNKWLFPNLTLAAGERVVVFASGKDRDDAASELHTNFSLSADGEYLALVKPGGLKTSEFSPYPKQKTDVSYGQSSSGTNLVSPANPLKFTLTNPPNDAQSDAWFEDDFDDSSWSNGAAGGIGYDSNGTDNDKIETTVPSGTTELWVRIPFTLTSAPAFSSLTLRTIHDDGYQAYLNGTPIHAVNATNPVQVTEPSEVFADIDVSQHTGLLKTGLNVLSFRVVNASSNSSDLLLLTELTGIEQSFQYRLSQTPTPGTANTGHSYEGFVADTKFTIGRSIHNTSFSETITSNTPGATIIYTLDGSVPSLSNGTQVAAPDSQSAPGATVPINSTATLRTAAFFPEFLPSNTDTQTYIFPASVVNQPSSPAGWPAGPVNGQRLDYGMDTPSNVDASSSEVEAALLALPSISIVTDQDNLLSTSTGIYVNPGNRGNQWERPASVEMIFPAGYSDPDGNTEGFSASCGLRIRGGFSLTKNNAKHSFRLFFKQQYGDARLNYKLFGNEGASSFKRIDFRTAQNYAWSLPSSNDGSKNTFIRDVMNRDSQRDMGWEYTRSRYFHLYLNGLYWGLYMTQERADAHHGDSYLGGKNEDYDAVKSSGSANGYRTEATNGDLAGGAWEATWNLSKDVRDASSADNSAYFQLQGMDNTGAVVPAQQNYLDVDSLIDYMLIVFYSGSADSPLAFGNPSNNWFGMRNRATNEHGFQFFMHDSEHSLDARNATDVTGPYSPGKSDALNRSNPQFIHEYLSNNDEYKIKFADHAHAALNNGGPLSHGKTLARIASREATIDTAIIAESARWGDERPQGPYTHADWLSAVNGMRNWLNGREATLLSQLRADSLYPDTHPPSYNQHGGLVVSGFQATISHPNSTGTIYYTTDGTDPRAIGGAVAGTSYSSAISVTQATTIKSRVLDGGEWSALTEATFTLGETPSPMNLAISEFSYQPGESTLGAADGDDFEFIEIMNTGASAIDLTNLEFNQGVTFDFATLPLGNRTLAPGARAVVVEDAIAFQARYGTSITILGEWVGKLSNSGETIRLGIKGGSTVQLFTYSDNLPWPTCADGLGYSLVLKNPTSNTNHNDPANWRCSITTHGVPGGSDALPVFTGNANEDLDHDGLPALIEHFLGSSENDSTSGVDQLSSGIIEVTNGGITSSYLTLSFRKKLGTDDLKPSVEVSTTLEASSWLTGETHVTMISQDHQGDGTIIETWRTITPISTTQKLFMRLKVVQE